MVQVPRFHFDLYDRLGSMPDEEGRDLRDLDAARSEALKGVRSVIAAEVERGLLDLTGKMVVRDGDGTVLTLAFHEALTINGLWNAPGGADGEAEPGTVSAGG